MIGLTKRQREVLDYIRSYVIENGYSPSVGEVATYFSISAPSALMHLRALQKKNVITRGVQARSIVLVGEDQAPKATPPNARLMVPCYLSPADMMNKQVSEQIFISPEFISSIAFRQLFAIRIDKNLAIAESSIIPNDILILKLNAIADHNQLCLANQNGKFILGFAVREGKNVWIKRGEDVYKDLAVLGTVLGLQRAYDSF